MRADEDRASVAAVWFGILGAVPFIAGAAAVGLAAPATATAASAALLTYGAIVLSFLGGLQWGLAVAAGHGSGLLLARSMVPALVGWAAALLGGPGGLAALAAAFAAQLALDLRAARPGRAPRAVALLSPRLRQPLAGVVVATLLAASYFSGLSARSVAEAGSWLDREIASLEERAGEDGGAEALPPADRLRLAEALRARGAIDGHVSDYRRAAELYRSALGEPAVQGDGQIAGRAALGLGECLEALGRRLEARRAYALAMERLEPLGRMPIVEVARNGVERSSR